MSETINNSINLPVRSSNNKYVSVVIPSVNDCYLKDQDILEKPLIKGMFILN